MVYYVIHQVKLHHNLRIRTIKTEIINIKMLEPIKTRNPRQTATSVILQPSKQENNSIIIRQWTTFNIKQ